ncbi:MAG TPA: lysophospholipid acyltransferase family protein [Limnochordia bacterium]|nr:lysophospholipid acyltransferase family protein [Limnochordia bacterium]
MYRFLVAIIRFLVLLIWGLDVEGAEHIPEESGAIIAGTHTSWFDPFVLAAAIKRPVHFMGKAELFENPFLAWLISQLNAFPVKRGQADREAIRTSQEKVSAGHLLGMFPEGTRNKTGNALLPLQGGVALVAIKSGVPVLPAIVSKGRRRGLRRPFKVVIGEPIDLGGPKKANKTDVARGSEVISVQFRSLLSRNN